MVNTERLISNNRYLVYYNILNIVVNTEQDLDLQDLAKDYNILNIVVNTEPIK